MSNHIFHALFFLIPFLQVIAVCDPTMKSEENQAESDQTKPAVHPECRHQSLAFGKVADLIQLLELITQGVKIFLLSALCMLLFGRLFLW